MEVLSFYITDDDIKAIAAERGWVREDQDIDFLDRGNNPCGFSFAVIG